MFCPICRVEHREGFTRCLECDIDLINDIPPEQVPEYENLIPVFEGDSDSAAVARATVEGAGIESWAGDEEVHGLFPSLGLTEVLVREEDEKLALKALAPAWQEKFKSHGSDRLTSKHSLSTSFGCNQIVRGACGKKNGKKEMKEPEPTRKDHHNKDRIRQGKY
jgi:hypothetical protein